MCEKVKAMIIFLGTRMRGGFQTDPPDIYSATTPVASIHHHHHYCHCRHSQLFFLKKITSVLFCLLWPQKANYFHFVPFLTTLCFKHLFRLLRAVVAQLHSYHLNGFSLEGICQMCLQMACLNRCIVFITLIWFFTSMTLHVNFQICCPVKPFLTYDAFYHISFQVNKCFMCQKFGFSPRLVRTIITSEKQPLVVNSFMNTQSPCLREYLATIFTFMYYSFMSSFFVPL